MAETKCLNHSVGKAFIYSFLHMFTVYADFPWGYESIKKELTSLHIDIMIDIKAKLMKTVRINGLSQRN